LDIYIALLQLLLRYKNRGQKSRSENNEICSFLVGRSLFMSS